MFNKKLNAQKTVATLLTVGVLGGALLFATQYVAPSPREEWRSQAASLQHERKRSDLSLTVSSDFLLYPARVVVSDEGIFEELMGAVDAQRFRR